MRRRQKIWIGLTVATVLVYAAASWRSGQKDDMADDGDVVYTVVREGDIALSDDDVIQYSAEILNADGEHILGGVLSWGVVRNNVPPLQNLIKKVKVGGEGRLVAPYGSYFPGGGKSFLPQGQTVYAEVKVERVIPQRYAVEVGEDQGAFLAIDIGGEGKLDTLGGEEWRRKKPSAKWLDSRNARRFSLDGGDAVLCDWLGPRAGLLVKRGDVSGDINGYELVGRRGGEGAFKELQTFDSNGDGIIAGDELEQLWVWVDSNSNAEIDEGELRLARDVFDSINSTHPDGADGEISSPLNGATLKDGRTVGAWEWWTRRANGGWTGPRNASQMPSRASGENVSLFLFNACGKEVPDLLGDKEDLSGTRRVGLRGGGAMPTQRWHWVGPCAGLLMVRGEDSAVSSQIGEYLIGSETGGQTWDSSYEALTFFDTDGNGVLEGSELDAISVWIDRSSDARIDSWEVSKASDTISSISLTPKRNPYGVLSVAEGGVVFKDGTSSPSWCWSLEEAPTAKAGRD